MNFVFVENNDRGDKLLWMACFSYLQWIQMIFSCFANLCWIQVIFRLMIRLMVSIWAGQSWIGCCKWCMNWISTISWSNKWSISWCDSDFSNSWASDNLTTSEYTYIELCHWVYWFCWIEWWKIYFSG